MKSVKLVSEAVDSVEPSEVEALFGASEFTLDILWFPDLDTSKSGLKVLWVPLLGILGGSLGTSVLAPSLV